MIKRPSYLSQATRLLSVSIAAALSCFSPADSQAAVTWLFDFGSAANATTGQAEIWNNITNAIGTTSTGLLPDLVTTTGVQTSVDFQMIARFNGDNQNGTQASSLYPTPATRDSLFGNTEVFNGLSNVFPAFKFTSLDPALTYNFTFYASRLGVTDTRTTDYTVAGSISGTVTLNVANNVDNAVTLSDISPDAFGEITISLAPGIDNNNANHFTYLGVLRMEAIPEPAAAMMLIGGLATLCLRRSRHQEGIQLL